MTKKFHSRWRLPSALLLPLFLSPLMAVDRFHGRVSDAQTRQGIAGVNVVLVGTVSGTLTDAEGRFSLGVQPGAVLRLTHIAYDELEWTVTAEQLRAARIQAFSMSPRLLHGEPVFVTATRGEAGQTPVAFSTLGHDELTAAAPFEDVPMALAGLPGVYAFSDAGHGVGYTYLKIRGFDQDRISVMINGIPLNDPESHQVYWVDHGDILAGTGSVQVQRGVGSSLYGSAAMGGSVNMVTSPRATPRGLTLQTGYGDFTDAGFSSPSRKFAVQWTGLPLAGRALTLYGRYSGIRSDGYRLGSGTRQDALHLIGEYLRPLSSTRLELITGAQVTHFSWDGIAPLDSLADREQRRYNSYADPFTNGGRSDANKDVFTQSIAALQHARKLASGIASVSVYGVTGRGYYEQFRGGEDVVEYNLKAVLPDTVVEADLIRRKWLDNGYWGVIPQYTIRGDWGMTVLGGDYRRYSADHYGRVLSVDGWDIGEQVEYYRYVTAKTTLSAYMHQLIRLGPAVNMMFDLKYTAHFYHFDQDSLGAFTRPYQYGLTYQFLDPRLGLWFKLNDAVSAFTSISHAQREPADSDIYDSDNPWAVPALIGAPDARSDLEKSLVRAEELWDVEVGWTYRSPKLSVTTNLYSMWFQNELIPLDYRTITEDGVPTHGNADLTVHRGLEVEFSQQLTDQLALDGSLTMADNRFVDYTTFEWQVDSSVNHGGKQIPGHPQSMGRMRLKWASSLVDLWGEGRYTGRIFLDRQNTAEAAIEPSLVINAGLTFRPPVSLAGPLPHMRFNIKVNNLLDSLYETFGYNYWDWDAEADAPYRVDVYWPAATRSYFAELVVRF